MRISSMIKLSNILIYLISFFFLQYLNVAESFELFDRRFAVAVLQLKRD